MIILKALIGFGIISIGIAFTLAQESKLSQLDSKDSTNTDAKLEQIKRCMALRSPNQKNLQSSSQNKVHPSPLQQKTKKKHLIRKRESNSVNRMNVIQNPVRGLIKRNKREPRPTQCGSKYPGPGPCVPPPKSFQPLQHSNEI